MKTTTIAFKQQMKDIMTSAWQICKVTGETFAECLRRSWQCYKLRSAMMSRIVEFWYKKVTDNTTRQAFGTLDPHRYEYNAVGGRDYKPADCIRYWDTTKNGWRMFKKYNLIKVEL